MQNLTGTQSPIDAFTVAGLPVLVYQEGRFEVVGPSAAFRYAGKTKLSDLLQGAGKEYKNIIPLEERRSLNNYPEEGRWNQKRGKDIISYIPPKEPLDYSGFLDKIDLKGGEFGRFLDRFFANSEVVVYGDQAVVVAAIYTPQAADAPGKLRATHLVVPVAQDVSGSTLDQIAQRAMADLHVNEAYAAVQERRGKLNFASPAGTLEAYLRG